jgi:predicted  nucleic acid-binding Zn-ribbon protein
LGTLRDDLNKATLATEQFEAMEKDYQERIQRLQDEIKQNKASFLNELKYIEKERDHLKMHGKLVKSNLSL